MPVKGSCIILADFLETGTDIKTGEFRRMWLVRGQSVVISGSLYIKIHSLLSKMKNDFWKGCVYRPCIVRLRVHVLHLHIRIKICKGGKNVLTKLNSWVSFIAVIEEFNFCPEYAQLVHCLELQIPKNLHFVHRHQIYLTLSLMALLPPP